MNPSQHHGTSRATGPTCRRRPLVAVTTGLVLSLLGSAPAAAQGGVLDPAFGLEAGVSTLEVLTTHHTLARHHDGSVLVGGGAVNPATSRSTPALFRYLADGTPDPAFGGGEGFVALDPAGRKGEVLALDVDELGRILMAGPVTTPTGYELSAWRRLPNGALDTSFGVNGVSPILATMDDAVTYAFGFAADGGALIARSSVSSTVVTKLRSDGKVDPAFGTDGSTSIPLPSIYFSELEVEADGGILLVGTLLGGPHGIAVVRLLPDGTLDASYGASGLATAVSGPFHIYGLLDTELLPDGRLLIGGYAGWESPLLARLSPDGTPDPSFGAGGVVLGDTIAGGPAHVRTFAVQPDGKILIVGQVHDGSTYRVALARYHADGARDEAFGTTELAFGSGTASSPHDMLADAHGKLLIAGTDTAPPSGGGFLADPFGWLVRVLGQVWTSAGAGLAGAQPAPELAATGTLLPGQDLGMTLTGAAANSSAFLVLGFSELSAPFKGGTLVPSPDLLIPLSTSSLGDVSISSTMPLATPAGLPLVGQFWVVDATGPSGFTASNGVLGVTQ